MPIQESSVYRMGWLQCWRWRKAAGPRGRVQLGFLHRVDFGLSSGWSGVGQVPAMTTRRRKPNLREPYPGQYHELDCSWCK